MAGLVRRAMLAGLAGIVVAVLACSGPQEPAGEGEECYRAMDCQVGLVCVPTTGGGRVCSTNISGLVDQVVAPPPPEDAGMMEDVAPPIDDGAAPMDDGAAPMDDGAAPMDDGAAPMDDGAAPPPDGG